jgi:cytochrome P450
MEYDPFSYEIHADPYPTYRYLRDHAPLYHNPTRGFFALSRFADVKEATLDWQTYSSAQGTTLEDAGATLPMMLFMDPPRQTRLRNLVSRAFTRQRVAALEPQIRALTAGYLDPLVEQGACDIVRDFTAKLPMDVISTMLGIPPQDRDMVRSWSNQMLHREPDKPEPPPKSLECGRNLGIYFVKTLAGRRKHPREDMMTALLHAEIKGHDGRTERLADDEILGFCILLAIAGNETVTKLLASAIYWLWRNPEQRALLVKDPGRIPGAVEETLRYDPPSQYQGRVVTRDAEIHGGVIPRGSRVLLLTGSSGRDEREFADPDRFDITRKIEEHLGFGLSRHICLGASLARLESRIALEEIHARFPDYEIDERGLERIHSSNVRGFAAVPLRYGA